MLRRSEYKHYQNRGQPGERIFVSTTVLDFVEVFKSPKLADLFTEMLFESHQSAGAILHGFVVMSHHVHFLTTLPPNQDAPRFVGALKSQSARAIRPKIDPAIERAFDARRGLDGRMFWQRSFRSYTILRNEDFEQKPRYIHLNPVLAGLCEYPEQYRWSSACFIEAQLWFADESIRYEDWLRLAPALVG